MLIFNGMMFTFGKLFPVRSSNAVSHPVCDLTGDGNNLKRAF